MFSEGSAPGSIFISSISPVKDELFTLRFSLLNIIKSQGIFYPAFIFTISPGTIFFAFIFWSFPSLKTKASFGMKLEN